MLPAPPKVTPLLVADAVSAIPPLNTSELPVTALIDPLVAVLRTNKLKICVCDELFVMPKLIPSSLFVPLDELKV
jgi:hypothetical protein